MARCCYAAEYGELFNDRTARRTARRYARKGLRGSAEVLADALTTTGVEGATLLEVGGGVGAIHVELLHRGADSACNVELSPQWEHAARQLLVDRGLHDRVQRRVGDFVDVADELPDVDVVLLHRVLCCYPDWEAMTAAAAAKATRVVGLTLPVERRATKAAVAVGNRLQGLRGQRFRAYVHPVADILAALRAAGLRVRTDHRGLVWRTVVAERFEGERR